MKRKKDIQSNAHEIVGPVIVLRAFRIDTRREYIALGRETDAIMTAVSPVHVAFEVDDFENTVKKNVFRDLSK